MLKLMNNLLSLSLSGKIYNKIDNQMGHQILYIDFQYLKNLKSLCLDSKDMLIKR